MLTRVEVRTRQGNLLGLQLDDISNGFIVEEIEGLDPVKATLVSSGFAGQDGEQFHSSRREARDLVFKIGLEPQDLESASVKDLRDKLYSFFMPKKAPTFRFYMLDGLVVDAVGRVESFVCPLFVQEPVATITVRCFDPDFYELTTTVVNGLSTDAPGPTDILYNGTVETGIRLILDVNRTLSEFTVYHTPPGDGIRSMQFVAPLVAGDRLTISTVYGNKGATLLRGGTETSLLYGISPQSNWIEFSEGVNAFQVYAVGAGIPASVEYITRYGAL